MADILLIVPPFKYGTLEVASLAVLPHLGIAFIASVLEQNNYSVEILDASALEFGLDEIRRKIRLISPSVVGVTDVTSEIDVCKLAKEIDPHITTVLGGPRVTVVSECADSQSVDYIVIGEGESTIIELMNYILRGKVTKSKIKGIGYREKGKLKLTEPRSLIKNLDELPMPAYHLLPMNLYKPYGYYDVGRKFTTMITSRGCPYTCIYCSSSVTFGHRWRAMSPVKVFEGIKMLNSKYGISHIYFQDDEFTINHQRTEKICELIIRNKLNVVWECFSRVDHVNDRLISQMARAGCKAIFYGTECGYQEGLNRIKKGITLEQTRDAIKITKKYGIQARASFMIGFPWEGEKEIRQTIEFAKELDADITGFQVLVPYPGTEVYEEMKQKNLIRHNERNQYTEQPVIGGVPVTRTEYLTSGQLKELDNQAYSTIYNNPLHLIKRLSKTGNLTHLKRNLLSGVGLIRNTLKFNKKYITRFD